MPMKSIRLPVNMPTENTCAACRIAAIPLSRLHHWISVARKVERRRILRYSLEILIGSKGGLNGRAGVISKDAHG